MARERSTIEFAANDSALQQSLRQIAVSQKVLIKNFEQMGKAGAKAGKDTKRGADEAGKGLKDAGNKGKQAFGRNAAAGLQSYATGLFSVATGAVVARQALAALAQERRAASAALRESVNATGQLAQLAGGDKEELGRLLGEVRKTRVQTGASVEEGAKLQFTLESVGAGKERKFFAGFRNIVKDPALLAEGASTLQEAFGEEETGSLRSITNKLLASSKESKTGISAFAPAATIAAKTASAIGTSDEELLAALAILSRALKSADLASTQLSALSDVIGKKGLGGEGILAAIPKIQSELKGKSPKERQEFFGRKEARKGFANLVDLLPQIRELEEVVTAAAVTGPNDLSAGIKRSFLAIPANRAVRDADIAKQRELLAGEEGLGLVQVRRDEARSNVRAASLRRGEAPFPRLATGMVTGGLGFFGASPETIQNVDRSLVPNFERGIEQFFVGIISDIMSGRIENQISNPRGGGLPKGAEHRFDDTADKFDRVIDKFDRSVDRLLLSPGGPTMQPPNRDE